MSLCELIWPLLAFACLLAGMYLQARFNSRDWGDQTDEHEELTK